MNDIHTTLLGATASRGQTECMKELLKHGAIIEAKDDNKNTPLLIAVEFGSKDIVQELLQAGADIQAKSAKGKNVLINACVNNHLDILKLLLIGKTKICANYGGHANIRALHVAAWKGHVECAQLLLNNGAFVDAKNDNNLTPLLLAANRGHLETVKLLIQHGANVNLKGGASGRTPLACAAGNGQSHCVQFLLNIGADINETDNDRYTPLHLAVKFKRTECVTVLVRHQNSYRSTPLQDIALILQTLEEVQRRKFERKD